LPTSFLSGTTAAASIGLINSVGNLGGFVGPYVVGYLKTGDSYFTGVLYLSVSALAAACLVLSLRATRANKLSRAIDTKRREVESA
jgi:ACS family tartrate transporter-like MFS transporter